MGNIKASTEAVSKQICATVLLIIIRSLLLICLCHTVILRISYNKLQKSPTLIFIGVKIFHNGDYLSAFVKYHSEGDAKAALKAMSGLIVDGERIVVDFTNYKENALNER